MVRKIAEPPKPYVWQAYPRWVTGLDGVRKIVQNHEHEERETGIRMCPDGTPWIDPELENLRPPTLQEVIAAGYKHEVAEKIVDEENYKFKAGYPPYGTNQPPAIHPEGTGTPIGPVETAPVETPASVSEAQTQAVETMSAVTAPPEIQLGQPEEAVTAKEGW